MCTCLRVTMCARVCEHTCASVCAQGCVCHSGTDDLSSRPQALLAPGSWPSSSEVKSSGSRAGSAQGGASALLWMLLEWP